MGPAVASVLALVLSLLNLYVQRRDRSPRLRIRVRYEYRAGGSREERSPSLGLHDEGQKGLYMRLGDFLREHELDYPGGSPVVRFTISNEGEKVAYLGAVRLVVRGRGLFGGWMILDPVEGRVVARDLAKDHTNVAGSGTAGNLPVEIPPGDGIGYRFPLTLLANTLAKEGFTGDVRLVLEAADRLGNTYARSFRVDTDLWAYGEDIGDTFEP